MSSHAWGRGAVLLALGGFALQARALEAPLLKAIADGDDAVLTWSSVADSTHYNVYLRDALETEPVWLASVVATEYRDLAVLAGDEGVDRYYHVTAASLSSESEPSNMAAKLSYRLWPGNRNYISLPYMWSPEGDAASETPSALAACRELNRRGCDIRGITRNVKRSTLITPVFQPCAAPVSLFDIPAGLGIALTLGSESECVLDVVGAHDERYDVGGSRHLTLMNGYNLVALPFNVVATRVSDLCRHLMVDNPSPGEMYGAVRITPTGPMSATCGLSGWLMAIYPGSIFLNWRDSPDAWAWNIQWRTH